MENLHRYHVSIQSSSHNYLNISFLLISGNTQEDRDILVYMEKLDHSQTVIVVVPCGGQLTVSMFGQEETKTQQIEFHRMKASEYKNTKNFEQGETND